LVVVTQSVEQVDDEDDDDDDVQLASYLIFNIHTSKIQLPISSTQERKEARKQESKKFCHPI
jgi:hypothetical protein